jgi:peroxiredoxin
LILLLFLAAVVTTYISLKRVENNSKFVEKESLPFALIADRMVLNLNRFNNGLQMYRQHTTEMDIRMLKRQLSA